MGRRRLCRRGFVQDLEANQSARHLECSVRCQTCQPELARIGAAVDLALEEHVAGFDPQAVGGGTAALGHLLHVEQLVAQRCRLGGGYQQLVAELAAEADAADHQVPGLEDAEVPERKHGFLADQARKDAAARRTLQRENRERAGGVMAAVAGAAAGEKPEPVGVQAPHGRVDQHRAVRLEQQRVGDLPGHERGEVARLQRLQLGPAVELVQAHEREVEQARAAAGGQGLVDAAHSERASMKTPTATHRPAAMRRRTAALTACAVRAPITTPSIDSSDTQAAVAKSSEPNCRLPSVPDAATTICSTWLVPTAASGTKPSAIIIGTENSAPPAPESPEPKPASAPTPASNACCAGPRPSR